MDKRLCAKTFTRERVKMPQQPLPAHENHSSICKEEKTRDYIRVYETMMIAQLQVEASGGNMTDEEALELAKIRNPDLVEDYGNIERMMKEYKTHRNIVDLDSRNVRRL